MDKIVLSNLKLIYSEWGQIMFYYSWGVCVSEKILQVAKPKSTIFDLGVNLLDKYTSWEIWGQFLNLWKIIMKIIVYKKGRAM